MKLYNHKRRTNLAKEARTIAGARNLPLHESHPVWLSMSVDRALSGPGLNTKSISSQACTKEMQQWCRKQKVEAVFAEASVWAMDGKGWATTLFVCFQDKAQAMLFKLTWSDSLAERWA